MILKKSHRCIYGCPESIEKAIITNDVSLNTLPTEVNNSHPQKNSSQQGLRKGWMRVTFILKEEHVENLKALAYWERSTIKDIVDDALSMYLKNTQKRIVER